MLSKKVLIIDDETDLCLLLQNYFMRKNYDVIVAHSLNEGKLLLSKIKPDILFIDNNLPDGTGWDNVPDIAADFPGTYIVMMSAFQPVVPVMPENAHYTAIEKPISMADLDEQFSFF